MILDNWYQRNKAFFQFEKENPTHDSSEAPLSKQHSLHFNQGVIVTNVPKHGCVLILDGKAFADAKNIGDQDLQLLSNLKLSIWAKANGEFGAEQLDNVHLAFGDVDEAKHNGTWLRTSDEEIASYTYILSYTQEVRLKVNWEYHDEQKTNSPPKKLPLASKI